MRFRPYFAHRGFVEKIASPCTGVAQSRVDGAGGQKNFRARVDEENKKVQRLIGRIEIGRMNYK